MGRLPRRWRRVAGLAVAAAAAVAAPMLGGQTRNPTYVPLPDPGYGLYYHDSQAAPNSASRWGYHDGWEEGRHDRNHGQTVDARTKLAYTTPPEHSGHPDSARDQYIKVYRVAYMQGYEHGSRL